MFQVHLIGDKTQLYAAKVTQYRNNEEKKSIIHENELLHRLSNGLYIKDMYHDKNKRCLIMISKIGVTLSKWFRSNEVKEKFSKENDKNKEIILKVIVYKLLLSLNDIHQEGLIHRDVKPGNILVTKNESYNNKIM